MRRHSFAFENSDEASESGDSPGMGRILQQLKNKYESGTLESQESQPEPGELIASATRYPGAKGLPSSLESDEEEEKKSGDKPSDAPHNVRSSRRDSFSEPTSPTMVVRPKAPNKAQELLGISSAGLRRESVRFAKEKSEKKDVSDRLQIELASNSTLWTSSDMPLEMVLADPVHRKMFRMLAESKMCLESVLLWERCNDFKKLVAKEPAVGPPLAFNIYSNFLAPSATKQVLVRDALLDPIRRAAVEKTAPVTIELFDQVQTEAYSTMQFSLYPEYLAFLNASRVGRDPSKRHSAMIAPVAIPSAAAASPVAPPTLRDCLCKAEFSSVFHAFATTLLAGENVDFWHRVVAFQSLKDQDAIQEEAKKIYGTFLSPASASELNVSSKIRKSVKYEVENSLANAATFDDAHREVYRLLSLDVYPKFCQVFVERRGKMKL